MLDLNAFTATHIGRLDLHYKAKVIITLKRVLHCERFGAENRSDGV